MLSDIPGFAFDLGGPLGELDAWSIATDSAANTYVTGRFQGIVDFNTANGEQTVVDGVEVFQSTPSGGADGYVAKYDADGAFQWRIRRAAWDIKPATRSTWTLPEISTSWEMKTTSPRPSRN